MSLLSQEKSSELTGVALLGGAALLSLSLFSYHPLDSSWNVSSPAGASNLVGPVGAWMSDFLFQVLGVASFLLPVPLLVLGYKRLRGRAVDSLRTKTVSTVVLVVAICAMIGLLAPGMSALDDYAAGGVLGLIASEALSEVLNWMGALVLLATVLLVTVLANTRFSVDEMFARLKRIPWTRPSFLRRAASPPENDGQPAAEELPGPRTLFDDLARDPVAEQGPLDEEARPEVKVEEEYAALLEGRGTEEEGFAPLPDIDPDLPFQLPPIDFLQVADNVAEVDKDRLYQKSEMLISKYKEFDVRGQVLQIHPGPVVTTFEFKPDPGVKYSKVTSLEQDLCLGLKAESVRIDRIPGKNTVGVEVPNDSRQVIYLREILGAKSFQDAPSPLTVALGKQINGNTYIADLAKMPHLLIAGATGSGKSVGLNCMVCSILYKALPSEVRFIMIDPKRLELGLYEDIPHLLTPIVTDPKQASNALRWAVTEMEQRYKLLARHSVRNITQFNRLIERKNREAPEEEQTPPLPFIVIIVDELADLMMTAGKDVEASLTRLAQMARAIGIHLILATQRPSVDVITGLIKANFPCRIAFRVSSRIDSRTIIDGNGAEALLGMGDMLFLPPGTSRLIRLHGPFLGEGEIGDVTKFLREQADPQYQEEILVREDEGESAIIDPADLEDPLYEEASHFVVETRKASTSLLQRRFRIGYGRAARLLDIMEHEGLISSPDGSKAREVRVAADYFDEVG